MSRRPTPKTSDVWQAYRINHAFHKHVVPQARAGLGGVDPTDSMAAARLVGFGLTAFFMYTVFRWATE